MKWYVMYVTVSEEIRIRDDLRKRGIPAMAPQEEIMIRKDGRWKKNYNILFSGYVFVGLNEWDADIYYCLKKEISGIIKVLYSPLLPSSLYDYEVENLMLLCQDDDIIEMSEIVKCGDDITVTAGALKGLEGKIIEVIPRQHRVKVKISLMGAERVVTLGANIIKKSENEQG